MIINEIKSTRQLVILAEYGFTGVTYRSMGNCACNAGENSSYQHILLCKGNNFPVILWVVGIQGVLKGDSYTKTLFVVDIYNFGGHEGMCVSYILSLYR